jgi:hypothetical protein
MQSNTLVLETLQTLGGYTTGDATVSGMSIFNSSALPVIFDEFQNHKQVFDDCSVIIESAKNKGGRAILISAVSSVMQTCETNMSRLKQRIAKQVDDGLNDADRHAFFKLDEDTRRELAPLVVGDTIVQAGLMAVEKQRNEAIPTQ